MDNSAQLPKFTDLPLRKGDPPHSAWGLYGKDDQLGTLNRLTDDVVLKAAKEEIQSGKRSVMQRDPPKPYYSRKFVTGNYTKNRPMILNMPNNADWGDIEYP